MIMDFEGSNESRIEISANVNSEYYVSHQNPQSLPECHFREKHENTCVQKQ